MVSILCIPGVWSTIQRTGQARYLEKTYEMLGPADGGLEMRAIAGGCIAYFKSMNYVIRESPQHGRIRFVGNMQGSMREAFYLVCVAAGNLFALGLMAQAFLPEGLFRLGPNIFFAPMLLAPAAGQYYWSRAARKDIVELKL